MRICVKRINIVVTYKSNEFLFIVLNNTYLNNSPSSGQACSTGRDNIQNAYFIPIMPCVSL